MSSSGQQSQVLREVLPKAGLVVSEKGNLTETLCKPKIMPLKSVTLQRLEEMEAKITEAQKQQSENASQASQQFVDSMAAYAAAAAARHNA